MEINEMNAQRVDDVYSKLAAISASNVDEISTAMTKVASLANNANMEFETTAAFLAQIIETTRESAETAGTALKTVVARFSQVNELYSTGQLKGQDEEGETIDVNKISTALRTAGIDLNKYFLGEVGLDDIFMELASKWKSLTSVQQRYIATQAAGSRQQSRFIALMSDYSRTQELVGAAYNANGAAAEQFAKTQDSLESKLARLKNSWNTFLMGLANSDIVKGVVDVLNGLLTVVNKITGAFGDGVGSILKWVTALGTLRVGSKIFNSTKLAGRIGQTGLGTVLNVGQQAAGSGFGKTGISGLLGKIGNKTASGIGNLIGETKLGGLGLKIGVSKAAMSGTLASVAAGLGAVAAAAGVAYGTYKLLHNIWLHTPAGLRKQAEELREHAKQLKEDSDQLSEFKTSYEQYTEDINNSTTVEEREKAIDARNKAIEQAIEANKDYAEFVSSDFDVTGKLVLTLDENKVTETVLESVKEATRASVEVYQKEAQAYLGEVHNFTYKGKSLFTGEEDNTMLDMDSSYQLPNGDTVSAIAFSIALQNEGINPEEYHEHEVYTEELPESLKLAQDTAKKAYAGIISILDEENQFSSDLKNALSTFLGKIFPSGELDDGLVTQLLEKFSTSAPDWFKLFYDNFDENFSQLDIDQYIEGVKTELEALEKELGATENSLVAETRIRAQAIKLMQQQAKGRTYSSVLKRGKGVELNEGFISYVERLRPSEVQRVQDLINSIGEQVDNSIVNNLLTELPKYTSESLGEIQSLFDSLNFDDPINAWNTINKAIEKGTKATAKWAGEIKSNLNDSLFSTSNLLQSFLISSEYEELEESISGIIEEDGKITTKNIDSLIESSKTLKNFIDKDVISTKELAAALDAVNKGAPIEGLTKQVITAIGRSNDLDDVIKDLFDTIENFDPGQDLTKGMSFLEEQIDAFMEVVDSYYLGGERFIKYATLLFGEEQAEDYYNRAQEGPEALLAVHDEIIERLTQEKELAANQGLGYIKQAAGEGLGIEILNEDEYGIDFSWDIGKKTTEKIKEEFKEAGYTVLETEAIIATAMEHIPGWAAILRQNDYEDALEKFVEDSKRGSTISMNEIRTLAIEHGKSTKQIIDDLQKLESYNIKKLNVPIQFNIDNKQLEGQDLIDKFRENLLDSLKAEKIIIDGEDFFEIDKDKWLEYLRKSTDLDETQIDYLAQHIGEIFGEAGDKSVQWTKEFEIPVSVTTDESGTVQVEYETKVAKGEYDKIEAEVEKATESAWEDVNVDTLGQQIASVNFSDFTDKLAKAIEQGGLRGRNKIIDLLKNFNINFTVTVNGNDSSNKTNTNTNFITRYVDPNYEYLVSQYVDTSASGGEITTTTFSLTGEEGPEIIWNKEGGYSYIAGANGPEFLTLYPGDRVFNAQDTARILSNSSLSSKFGSHAKAPTGRITKKTIQETTDTDTGTTTVEEEKEEPIEWRNEFDWLYNLMQDITELERKQTRLAEQHDRYLKDTSKTGRDLYNLTNAQLSNLYTQYNNQSAAYRLRQQEMQEQLAMSGASRYISWDSTGSKLSIDYNAIEALVDKDLYDKVKEMADTAEKIQSQIEEADDALWKIEGEIEELQNRYRDAYVDLEKRVMDALVQEYQNEIDELSEINDAVNDANNSILEALQEEISLSRQIRDNTDTENNIHEMEARLAYLRRDTTGANQNEILKLEKQLSDARRNYEDNLVDQSVERLGKQNDEAAEQREKNISLLTEQLEYWQEMGALWPEVASIINQGLSDDGALVTGSRLETILKDAEGWRGMSETQREVWAEELILATNQAGAYLIQLQNGLTQVGEDVTAAIGNTSLTSTKYWDEKNKIGTKGNIDFMAQMLSAAESGDYANVGTLEKLRNQKIDNEGLGDTYPKTYSYDSYMAGRNAQIDSSVDYMAKVLEAIGAGNWNEAFKLAGMRDAKIASMTNSPYAQDETFKLVFKRWYETTKGKRYAVGGLVTGTGPAWLDGTQSAPEYVLNAEQTSAFLRLADILPSMFRSGTNFTNSGNTYVDMTINVDSIADDYDVDRLIDRVKDDIYSSSQYRNVISLRQ